MSSVQINSFDDLLEFINENDLSMDQLAGIVFNAFHLIIVCTPTKELLVERLKKWWDKKNRGEPHGIFLETTEEIMAAGPPPWNEKYKNGNDIE